MHRRPWLIAASMGLLGASPLRAAPDVSAADAKAVRSVIEAQLAAFAADDADKAFSFAAPGIRAMFITAERFLSMVREGYPVVYRPVSVTDQVPSNGLAASAAKAVAAPITAAKNAVRACLPNAME